ncbi:hypothetical protein KKA14_19600, partial [bacterium]|nr:hypothetical protein [bacterium]
YSIKIYQESIYTLPVMTGLFTFITNLLVYLILIIVFSNTQFNEWLSKVILKEVLPTAVMSVPVFKLLVRIEKIYRIRLAERIF